jgi:DNA-binding beta-propeller fold protein YncE
MSGHKPPDLPARLDGRPLAGLAWGLVRALSGLLLALVLVLGFPVGTAASGPPHFVAYVNLSPTAIPYSLALDPAIHRLYVADGQNSIVYAIDTALDRIVTSRTLSQRPGRLAVDTTTNTVFVTTSPCAAIKPPAGAGAGAGAGAELVSGTQPLGSVIVLDGRTLQPLGQAPELGLGPVGLDVNSVTETTYVANAGCTEGTPPSPIPDSSIVAIQNGHATRIPIAGGTSSQLPLDAVAVDAATNTIYSAFFGGLLNVVDGNTNTVVDQVQISSGADSLAVNPLTQHVFVGMAEGPLAVIDAVTNTQIASVLLPGDVAGDEGSLVAVNTTLNHVYVTKGECALSSCAPHPNLWVIDGATNLAMSVLGTQSTPESLAVDPTTSFIYLGIAHSVWVFSDP